MKNLLSLILLVSCLMLNASGSLTSNPTINLLSLKRIFEGVKPYSDLANAFFSIKGLHLLGENLLDAQNAKELCDFTKAKVDKANLESIFYAVSLSGLIPNCLLDTSIFQANLAKGETSTSVSDLYFYAMTADALKLKIDSKKVAKSLTDALKIDSSILNQAYSLHIAALLEENNKIFYESIEDILDQADEVDKTFLQYEGGVGTTSAVLEGIISLSEKFQKLPATFTRERLTKFVNYLISKRFPTNIKSAYFLLRATAKLTDNKLAVPLVLNRLSTIGISTSHPNVLISVTNLLGGQVKSAQINVDAVSAASSTGKTLFSGKKISATTKSSDRTSFEIKLIEENQQPAPEFYFVTIELNLRPEEKQFYLTQNKIEVKATTFVNLVDVQVGVSDRDTTTPVLSKFEKVIQKDADQQSKFIVKFMIREKSKNAAVEAHQAFLKFTSATGREIIYLAEAGLNKQYSAEIDFSSNAKNFNYQSSSYTVELIVSDPLFENPIVLKLSELKLKFSEEKPIGLDKSVLYNKRPEIKHLFREPEPTPPATVSTLFAILCLVPLGIMVLLWFKIGFNFSKFAVTLPAIVFHLSLAAIFGLFYCYWVKLNMFQTIRYLAFIGLVALISGNKLLKNLVAEKEKKN